MLHIPSAKHIGRTLYLLKPDSFPRAIRKYLGIAQNYLGTNFPCSEVMSLCIGVFYKLPHLELSVKLFTLCFSILSCIFISKFLNHSPLCFFEFVNKPTAR